MQNESSSASIADSADYDAIVVGASLAGSATALQLGRAGASVALVEKSPDPQAFKRMCSHFIQASAVPTLERLELLEPIMEAGGIRSRTLAWTPWGWIEAPPERARQAVNLRRELLDPLLRETAAATPGVDLMLGQSAQSLLREGDTVSGVVVADAEGVETTLRAKLVVGADGRDSKLAKLAGVKEKVSPHGRFAYGAYFEGPPPLTSSLAVRMRRERRSQQEGGSELASTIWFLDPDWVAAFPTDSGLVFYAAMPTKDRLPEFKRDPEAALRSFVAGIPEAPPIGVSKLASDVLGKIEMPNRVRTPSAPGLALVGDAAMAVDPLFGVGCGWALQSAEWLSESVTPALRGEESLQRGLERYRRRHRRELRGHAFLINDYASGRRLSPIERLMFSAAARNPKAAADFDALGTRSASPARVMATSIPRAIVVNTRHALTRRRREAAYRPAAKAT